MNMSIYLTLLKSPTRHKINLYHIIYSKLIIEQRDQILNLLYLLPDESSLKELYHTLYENKPYKDILYNILENLSNEDDYFSNVIFTTCLI